MFEISNIPLFVKFYETLSCLVSDDKGDYELGGIIEVLERSKSRSDIGKNNVNLKD